MGGISLQLPCQLKCAVGCCESAMQRAAFSPQTEPHPAPSSAPRDSRRHRRRGHSAAPGRGRQSGAAGRQCRTAGPAWRTSGSGRGCGQWWPAAPARGQSPPRTAQRGKGEAGRVWSAGVYPTCGRGCKGMGMQRGPASPGSCRRGAAALRAKRSAQAAESTTAAGAGVPQMPQPQHVCNS